MKWKQFFYDNKKIISIIFIILTLVFIIASFLIYDRNKTRKEQLEKKIEAENYKKDLPKELKENIPDKGNMIFIEFFTDENKNKDILPLLKQEKFRKSLYYVLNRQKITQNENNLKPLSVLFTKAFFEDNKKCFPKPFLPHNEKSMEIYEDLDLKNYGFNENKALKCLEESWDQLSPEEQKQNYVLRFAINKDLPGIDILDNNKLKIVEKIQDKIVEQINNLFQKFLEKNTYNQDKLKIEIIHRKNYKDDNEFNIYEITKEFFNSDCDMILNFSCDTILNFDPDICFINNKFGIKDTFSYEDDSKISINLSHIKKYLENKRNQGKTVDVLFQNFFQNKELVDSQGIFTGKITDFYEYMKNNIFELFPSFKEGDQSQHEESQEIKELKQKTFEEIFEKVLCLLHKEMLQISVCVYNTENTN